MLLFLKRFSAEPHHLRVDPFTPSYKITVILGERLMKNSRESLQKWLDMRIRGYRGGKKEKRRKTS